MTDGLPVVGTREIGDGARRGLERTAPQCPTFDPLRGKTYRTFAALMLPIDGPGPSTADLIVKPGKSGLTTSLHGDAEQALPAGENPPAGPIRGQVASEWVVAMDGADSTLPCPWCGSFCQIFTVGDLLDSLPGDGGLAVRQSPAIPTVPRSAMCWRCPSCGAAGLALNGLMGKGDSQ